MLSEPRHDRLTATTRLVNSRGNVTVHSASNLSVPRNAADRLRWWMGGGSLSSLIERLTSRRLYTSNTIARPVHQQPCPMVRYCSFAGHGIDCAMRSHCPLLANTHLSVRVSFWSHPALRDRRNFFTGSSRDPEPTCAWRAARRPLCGHGVDGRLQPGPACDVLWRLTALGLSSMFKERLRPVWQSCSLVKPRVCCTTTGTANRKPAKYCDSPVLVVCFAINHLSIFQTGPVWTHIPFLRVDLHVKELIAMVSIGTGQPSGLSGHLLSLHFRICHCRASELCLGSVRPFGLSSL